MRRLLCGILAVVCVLTAVGCSSTVPTPSPSSSAPVSPTPSEELKNFALPYSKEDTLNPYAATTEVNAQLAGLLYDSLTVIDEAFMPQLSLAASVTQTDVTHVVVTLRQGAKFSDGTAVTSADVKASFDTARKSEQYKELLKNVAACAVDRKSGALTFTLSQGDPNAAACLCFPVLKSGKNTTKAGEAPLGGGIYKYTVTDNGAVLTANPHYGKTPRYATVQLRHLPNPESMYSGLGAGNITYYYNDLSSGDVPRVSGASAKVDMNALVYLGVNSSRGIFSQSAVRRALSLAFDRAAIASTAHSGWTIAATLPFHPKWGVVRQTSPLFGGQDLTAAAAAITAVSKKPTAELIYSLDSGNRGALVDAVRTQLEATGIRLTVTPLSYEEYMARLQSGNYDLYIGEIRFGANMDLSPMFTGAARYGVAADSASAAAYTRYRAGEQTLQEFLTAFAEDMPYIPLVWRCGFVGYDRRLLTVTPHGYDPYYGIATWQ